MVTGKLRLIGLWVAVALLLLPGLAAAAPAANFPDVIDLPNGFQPEGVVMGRGTTIYAGSLANGAIYQADVRTGAGRLLFEGQAGRIAAGLDFDRRTGYLFAAGGPTGQAYVYDTKSGADLGAFPLAAPGASFVNDVIVTRDGAYFTDSFSPVMYRLPLREDGRLPGTNAGQTIPLGGDYMHVPGQFNANGIVATANGKTLIIINSTTGRLYQVDPNTGVATLINVSGGSLTSGDGLLLLGRTLFVVRNFFNQIAVVALNAELSAGRVVDTLTAPTFDIPTTVTSFNGSLYAVNARFGTPPTPDTAYWITRLAQPREPQ